MIVAIAGREAPVASRAVSATSFWLRLRGLMLRRGFGACDGLWFDRCAAVHMFFVWFAIDLVWLADDLRVVGLVRGLRPWRLATCRRARSCLELPAGAIDAAGLAIGDVVTFSER